MSLHQWNTINERRSCMQAVLYTSTMMNYLYMEESSSSGDSSLDRSDGSDLSPMSYDSLSSSSSSSSSSSLDSSIDSSSASSNAGMNSNGSQSTTLSAVVCRLRDRAGAYYDFLTARIGSEDVEWGQRKQIDDLSHQQCILYFRFRKHHLQDMADLLWPKLAPYLDGTKDSVSVGNRYSVPYETGLLLVLFRFHRPTRIRPEMEEFFGMRKSHISKTLQTFVDALYSCALPYLSDPSIHAARIPYYARLISEKTDGVVDQVWGFIDGTLRKTSRPSYFQKLLYSGHKRAHGIKFQSVVTPDGLIACLFGPINGRRHDSFMLRVSHILEQLDQLMPIDGVMYALYGDPAYPQFPYLMTPYRNPGEGSVQAAFNTTMSSVRETVEWNFKEIVCQFAYLDWKAGMKIFERPVAKYYTVAAFFTNIRSLVYQNQMAVHFKCAAGQYSIEEYLDLVQ